MATSSKTEKSEDPTRLGECAAQQPLSGITRVDATYAVNGTGRGGYVRREEAQKQRARA